MIRGVIMIIRKVIREILEWIIVFATAFILVTLLNTAVFATTQVRQTSMLDTLMEGQHLFVEKLSYAFGDPTRGDIVVYIEDELPEKYIDRLKIFFTDVLDIFKPIEAKTNVRLVKRVIGVPGDEVDIRDGKVYLNGLELDEPYAKGLTYQREFPFPVKVPEGKYIVLGDNREVSKDSRTFGLIDRRQVEGKASFRFWPLNKIGVLR
jgi:signal peptidase I